MTLDKRVEEIVKKIVDEMYKYGIDAFPLSASQTADGEKIMIDILTQELQTARIESYAQGYTQGKFDEKMDTEYKHPLRARPS